MEFKTTSQEKKRGNPAQVVDMLLDGQKNKIKTLVKRKALFTLGKRKHARKASDAFVATTGAELREVRQWQSISPTTHHTEGVGGRGEGTPVQAGRQAGRVTKKKSGKR